MSLQVAGSWSARVAGSGLAAAGLLAVAVLTVPGVLGAPEQAEPATSPSGASVPVDDAQLDEHALRRVEQGRR